MLENRLFDEKMLDVLLHPETWRIISSRFLAEVKEIHAPAHRRWMKMHSHAHPHQEILLILKGDSYYGYRNLIYPACPRTVICFDHFEEHDSGYRASIKDSHHLWIEVFPTEIIAHLLPVHSKDTRSSFEWTRILDLGTIGISSGTQLLGRERLEHVPPELIRLDLKTKISIIVGALVREGYAPLDISERESFPRRIVFTIRKHIEETAGKGITLDSLAHLSGYSKFHFTRLFKQHTGHSIREYVEQCRRRRVTEMRQSGSRQKEIAKALGFSSTAVYSRWFHRQWPHG